MAGGRPDKRLMDADRDSIRLCLRLPKGYKYLPDGQHTVVLTSSEETVLKVPGFGIPDLTFDWRVPVVVGEDGETTLQLQAMVFFCPVSDESICMFNAFDLEVPVVVLSGAGTDLEIVHDIELME